MRVKDWSPFEQILLYFAFIAGFVAGVEVSKMLLQLLFSLK